MTRSLLSEDVPLALSTVGSVTGDLLGMLTRQPDTSQIPVQKGWEPGDG